MRPIAIVATATESALGSGEAAVAVSPVGHPARTSIDVDEALRRAGAKHPFVARAAAVLPVGVDRATALLGRAIDSLVARLDVVSPGWRRRRVGLALGTSSGGMISLTHALSSLAGGERPDAQLARAATYFGPIIEVPARLGIEPAEQCQVLAACASSGIAAGIGARWLEHGHVDLVIAGGYDAVSLLVAAGFECIHATSASRPAPFRVGRDGMALGEAVALWALAPISGAPRPFAYLRGFGASADAVHITAPDREGRGLAAAARAALADAACAANEVDLVSAHATATPYNDAAEAKAMASALGARAVDAVVHPFKAVVGHTLGAGSVLEATAALEACRRGILPAAAGEGDIDPDARVRLLSLAQAGAPSTVLGLSAAFGGANCALVASLEPGAGASRPSRSVGAAAVGCPVAALDVSALASLVVVDPRKLSRMDPWSALAVAATGEALVGLGRHLPERTAVVVGTVTASLENDELFHRRLRERGFTGAEPRRFPPTSPNLPAGQCGIAFGLRGPALSVGAGLDAALEALMVGFDLVAAGDADAAVVVAAEHVADAVPALFQAAGWPVPPHGAVAAVLEPAGDGVAIDRAALAARRAQLARSGGEGPFEAFRQAALGLLPV